MVAGNPIVVITPLHSDRIIAYVRQPMNFVPKVNDSVQVRRQTFRRETGSGKVAEVGTQMERVDPSLFVGSSVKVIDMALPFLIRLEDNRLNLAPGERVDVIFRPRGKPARN